MPSAVDSPSHPAGHGGQILGPGPVQPCPAQCSGQFLRLTPSPPGTHPSWLQQAAGSLDAILHMDQLLQVLLEGQLSRAPGAGHHPMGLAHSAQLSRKSAAENPPSSGVGGEVSWCQVQGSRPVAPVPWGRPLLPESPAVTDSQPGPPKPGKDFKVLRGDRYAGLSPVPKSRWTPGDIQRGYML